MHSPTMKTAASMSVVSARFSSVSDRRDNEILKDPVAPGTVLEFAPTLLRWK